MEVKAGDEVAREAVGCDVGTLSLGLARDGTSGLIGDWGLP